MKKLLLLISVFIYSGIAVAQYTPKNLPNFDRQQWHFGFTLGVNNMDFKIHPVDEDEYENELLIVEPGSAMGFNIGIVANKRLADYLDLRFVPTISFGERDIKYTFMVGDTIKETYVKPVTSTFLDFPLSIKYKSKRLPDNLNNTRAYVSLGARYSLDLSSQKNKDKNNTEIVLKLNPHDVLGHIGVGFDFYMKYFKFGVEIKHSLGFINVMHHEGNQFTSNIEDLYSSITWITFTFE